ncbi:MAG: glutamate racemase [Bacteroidales bacterium]|nr:glutamate racemase [Bacteroidales bacterium]
MKDNSCIGVFDSGVGGLSVWRELVALMPNESTVYYADSAYCPYGPKTQQEIINRSSKIVDFLLQQGAKLIVVACNTATAAAIDYLRANYSIPFVGMEPAVKPAAFNTKNGKIGVLATKGTFNGRLFLETSNKYASDLHLEIQVGEGFVELVEAGELDTDNAERIVKASVIPLLDRGIDQLVLACTHYPFLCETIKKVSAGKNINIINPAPSVAKQACNLLQQHNLKSSDNRKSTHHFYSSLDTKVLQLLVDTIVEDNTYKFEVKSL